MSNHESHRVFEVLKASVSQPRVVIKANLSVQAYKQRFDSSLQPRTSTVASPSFFAATSNRSSDATNSTASPIRSRNRSAEAR